MRSHRRKIATAALAVVLSFSLAGGALAYTTPDFTDVAPGNWAYEPVMEMADAGIIKGTGATTFSPDMKLSAAMFLTLVGRVAYPGDVDAEGAANWYTPWVEAAQAKGLLEGTAVTSTDIEGEITRYDMAVVLAHTAKALGAEEQTVDTSKIMDYGDIPIKYASAVGQTYALGLIQGDDAGRFNGTLTMTRSEAATVTARLVDLAAELATKPTQPEETTPREEDIPPRTGETETVTFHGKVVATRTGTTKSDQISGANLILRYKDGRELARTTSDEDGKFSFTVTMDKADFDWYEDLYYIDATYTAPDGEKLSNISVIEYNKQSLDNLYQVVKGGWFVTLYDDPERVDLDF